MKSENTRVYELNKTCAVIYWTEKDKLYCKIMAGGESVYMNEEQFTFLAETMEKYAKEMVRHAIENFKNNKYT